MVGETFEHEKEVMYLTTEINKKDKEIKQLKNKYEEPGQECNRGHKNTLPVKLWDCPVCTELLREKILNLEAVIEDRESMIVQLKQALKAIANKEYRQGSYQNHLPFASKIAEQALKDQE